MRWRIEEAWEREIRHTEELFESGQISREERDEAIREAQRECRWEIEEARAQHMAEFDEAL